MAEIVSDGIESVLESGSKELAMEAANRWFSSANESLLKAGDGLEYDVYPIVQASRPPQWNEQEQAAEMAWPHRASVFFENGTTKHEVEGDPILAFEWEEMRGEEFGDTGKTFEETFDEFPTVFLSSVTVSGIPRIGFVEHRRRDVARWMKQQEP